MPGSSLKAESAIASGDPSCAAAGSLRSSGDPGSSGDHILYGRTGSRHQSKLTLKDDLLIGVTENPYPRNLVPGEPWFPHAIVDKAVSELKSHTYVTHSDEALLASLRARLPRAKTGIIVRPWGPDCHQLHALMTETLPSWSKPKKQNGESCTRYGWHLGIGIYVYDPERERWYQRALHGRSIAAAHRYPLRTGMTAMKKRTALKERIESSNFNVAEEMPEGYPLVLSRLNESL